MDLIAQNGSLIALAVAGGGLLAFVGVISQLGGKYNLDHVKSKTTGDGQYGTARWATKSEINKTYVKVRFTPNEWREQAKQGKDPTFDDKPLPQGLVVGAEGFKNKKIALIDTNDVHALMIGAAGIGKTAYWLYPCIEYACASGMSFLTTDTKGDILRNYGTIAQEYGYRISVIDLRNPTKSHGNNIMGLVNHYMDLWKENPDMLVYRSKAEKYAKIISKTIIQSGNENASYGQNSYFYDAAEGILTSTILLVSEFAGEGKRHIVSVFKIIQQMIQPSGARGKTEFHRIYDLLPTDHKAKWYAAAALSSAEQSMSSVLSTALSRLNSFIDSELEQILCFDTEINAEKFCTKKSALFIIMPEENPNAYFMVSLIIQQMYREILAVADEMGGKLENRCVFFCDEFGTLPKIESAEMMFSASRSRRLQIVPIIQSFAQLNKNYGKEGAEIIIDNTQLTIFGGFAPSSDTAIDLSDDLGKRTVLSGSMTKSDTTSQSFSMIARDLMTPDELKSMPKGQFIIMKTGCHPMKTNLSLYFDWGIEFKEPFEMPDNGNRKVLYSDKEEIESGIVSKYQPVKLKHRPEPDKGIGGQQLTALECKEIRLKNYGKTLLKFHGSGGQSDVCK